MSSLDKFCLKWNDFHANISSSFNHMRDKDDFSDVTLVCDGYEKIEAHKVILSASSNFFYDLFKKTKHPYPLVYLRGMSTVQLSSVVDFIYHGKVNVNQEHLEGFLKIAEDLQVKGIFESEKLCKQDISSSSRLPKLRTELSKNASQDMKTLLNERLFEEPAETLTIVENLENIDPLFKNDPSVPNKTIFCEESSFKEQSDTKYIIQNSSDSFEENSVDPAGLVIPNTKLEDLDKTINTMMEWLGTKKGYACKICGKAETIPKSNMRNHIEAKHIEGITHTCNQCGKTIKTKNSLAAHVSRIHKIGTE